MKIAIFSDVHANLEALLKVKEDIESQGADRSVCLGDVVGYGASPNECCNIVRGMADVVILGNHDAAVAGHMDYSFYYDAARDVLDWTIAQLSSDNMEWLRSLEFIHREEDIVLCHGSPVNPRDFEYIFALEQARQLLDHRDKLSTLNFIGHSHLCKAFAIGPEQVHDVIASRLSFRKGYSYMISVGSVGQPRDYDNRAGYVLLDTDAPALEFRRIEYDIETAAKKIFDAGIAYNFGKRLFLGV
ncbi:MAG: metallophosphoesterase family protein [Deltaproteobacteria bacterium]|nr:metallophosphoesterase family protein [Deltaproteobacteria bacterium]